MKTILIPLTLTASDEYALAYANKLAVRWRANLVLLYCQPGPALSSTDEDALLTRMQNHVERMRYQQLVRQDARRLHYHFRALAGSLPEHIAEVVSQNAADLVVMSLEQTHCPAQAMTDNHPVRVSSLVRCPVLVVPPGRRPLPTRLVFATDFTQLSLSALPRLSALADALPGQMELVQIYGREQRQNLVGFKRALAASRRQLTWPQVNVQLLEDDDMVEGISEYCAHVQAQLLILSPTDEAQLCRFFDTCHTTTLAYHQQIPVLLLRPTAAMPAVHCCARCASRMALPDMHTTIPLSAAGFSLD
ncbi:universal stress protein [Hymenobacter sp. DG25A]|uniref:universal stress protein n=1 Tax=Hymenobacter sp. DG25A TaxID=1385663 RepID=UPI0006BC9517|nr:universal stress protein [Hymenobacter sp. DG25A]ALD22403.1 hypothetical protein AM218_15800 [Hymenobacter sp. DG25A]